MQKDLKTPGFILPHFEYRYAVNCKVLINHMLKVFTLYQGLSDSSTKKILQKSEEIYRNLLNLFWRLAIFEMSQMDILPSSALL